MCPPLLLNSCFHLASPMTNYTVATVPADAQFGVSLQPFPVQFPKSPPHPHFSDPDVDGLYLELTGKGRRLLSKRTGKYTTHSAPHTRHSVPRGLLKSEALFPAQQGQRWTLQNTPESPRGSLFGKVACVLFPGRGMCLVSVYCSVMPLSITYYSNERCLLTVRMVMSK